MSITPKVLNCFPEASGESFRPSNGTEGIIFHDAFCARCIHEKFMHTQCHGDLQCDILNRSLLFDKAEKGYPIEMQYNNEGWPVCINWKQWDWGSDDDDNGPNEPPSVYPDDPNQLCFPFLFDELEIPITQELIINE